MTKPLDLHRPERKPRRKVLPALSCPRCGADETQIRRLSSGSSAARFNSSRSECHLRCTACGKEWLTKAVRAWTLPRAEGS